MLKLLISTPTFVICPQQIGWVEVGSLFSAPRVGVHSISPRLLKLDADNMTPAFPQLKQRIQDHFYTSFFLSFTLLLTKACEMPAQLNFLKMLMWGKVGVGVVRGIEQEGAPT